MLRTSSFIYSWETSSHNGCGQTVRHYLPATGTGHHISTGNLRTCTWNVVHDALTHTAVKGKRFENCFCIETVPWVEWKLIKASN